MNLKEIRQKYPQYDAMSDGELAAALHQKFYSSIDFKDFSKRIGYRKGADPAEYDPESPEFKAKYGATSGMSGFQKYAAGYGKATTDLGRGIGQYVGAVSRDDVAESRNRDADLLSTGAGKAGYFTNSIAMAAPTAAIPGANTMVGAGLIGAGLGAIQPSTSTKETLTNTGVGGALGPASLLLGRAGSAVYRGGKALIEPFTKGGQERVAARTLQAFAGGRQPAQQAATSIRSNQASLPAGYQPTTAEIAGNAGIAQLERTLKNNPEMIQAFADRASGNRNAIMNTLDDVAGNPAKMAAAETARDTAASPLYNAAKKVTVKADSELGRLFARPSMQKAWQRAEALASEAGETLEPMGSDIGGRTLHYLKMGMDDLADAPPMSGIAANEARAIRGTRNQFLQWVEKNIPVYKQARETYAAGSRPINQMEIGTEIRNKAIPALADFGANTRVRPQAFAQALRDGDALAARSMDRSSAKLTDIMDPIQMRKLEQVGRAFAGRANADELGRAVGSNTGQNLASQNVLRQFLGPFGLPESTVQRAAESTLAQSIMRPVGFVARLGDQRAFAKLLEAGLDPQMAAKLLELGVDPKTIGLLRAQGLLAPTAVSGTNAARQ